MLSSIGSILCLTVIFNFVYEKQPSHVLGPPFSAVSLSDRYPQWKALRAFFLSALDASIVLITGSQQNIFQVWQG